MTETYTAPTNGHEIRRNADGGLIINKPGMDYVSGHAPQILVAGRVESLREYFRDERDRELGRWRDPKSPNVVIYPDTEGGSVRVVNEEDGYEEDGYEERWTRGQVKQVLNENCFGYDEARAYFDAHPEKKPWHDAKPGEVWVVDFEAGVTEAVVVPPGGWVKGLAVVAARRIWPESKES